MADTMQALPLDPVMAAKHVFITNSVRESAQVGLVSGAIAGLLGRSWASAGAGVLLGAGADLVVMRSFLLGPPPDPAATSALETYKRVTFGVGLAMLGVGGWLMLRK